jgi:hypothetical protein
MHVSAWIYATIGVAIVAVVGLTIILVKCRKKRYTQKPETKHAHLPESLRGEDNVLFVVERESASIMTTRQKVD